MSHYHEDAIERQRENAIWRPLLAQKQVEFQDRLRAPNVSYSLHNMDSLFARLDHCTSLKEKVQVMEYELASLPEPITPEKLEELHQRICGEPEQEEKPNFHCDSNIALIAIAGGIFALGLVVILVDALLKYLRS